MKCQEEGGCPHEAVGKDIQGSELCREHLAFSTMVQKLINAGLDAAGHPELVPDEYRFPLDHDRNN